MEKKRKNQGSLLNVQSFTTSPGKGIMGWTIFEGRIVLGLCDHR